MLATQQVPNSFCLARGIADTLVILLLRSGSSDSELVVGLRHTAGTRRMSLVDARLQLSGRSASGRFVIRCDTRTGGFQFGLKGR